MAAWLVLPLERRSQQPTAQAKGWQQTVSWRYLPAANQIGPQESPPSRGRPVARTSLDWGTCFPDHDEIRANRTDFSVVWQVSPRQKAHRPQVSGLDRQRRGPVSFG